eukprot:3546563-Alexandrium_andersonii.AAC.1
MQLGSTRCHYGPRAPSEPPPTPNRRRPTGEDAFAQTLGAPRSNAKSLCQSALADSAAPVRGRASVLSSFRSACRRFPASLSC